VHRGRFLVLLISFLLCLSAPATLLAIEVFSDTRVTVAIYNMGPAALDKIMVKSGDHDYSAGDLAFGHGQVVTTQRVAKGQIVVHAKGPEGDEQILQLPTDDLSAVSIAVKDGKLQSYSVNPRRKLWWR